MSTDLHPTANLLVETVSGLLETKSADEIQVDEVLEISGISKGSLYHHFVDLQELLEVAQVRRYTKWIDASIQFLSLSVATARNKESLMAALKKLTQITQGENRKGARAERALALAACFQNPRMGKAMGIETERLTAAIADVTDEVKHKGLFRADVDSKALATFIQAYTLGKIVNDYNPTGVSDDEWTTFIMKIVENTFLAP